MLTVITGPMYAGKSSRLLSIIRSNEVAGNQIVVFKPASDTRSTDEIVTHNSGVYPAIEIDNPSYVLSKWLTKISASVVFFDECQFFPANLISEVEFLLSLGYKVVCAGLAQDSFGKPFGPMPQLLCMADEIIHLKAVCSKCKKIGAATRTYRTIKSTEQTLVGGCESYEARCYECWRSDEA